MRLQVGILRWTFALLIKSTLYAKCHPVRLQNCTWNSAISDVGRQQLAVAREPPSGIRAHPGSPVNFRRATWKQYVKQGRKLPVDLYGCVCGWKSSAKLIRYDGGLTVARLVYFAVKINVYLRWLRNWWLRSSLPFLITGKICINKFWACLLACYELFARKYWSLCYFLRVQLLKLRIFFFCNKKAIFSHCNFFDCIFMGLKTSRENSYTPNHEQPNWLTN